MCKIQHTRSIILGLTSRFKHLKRTKCVCGRGFAQTPLVEPQTSYLVYGEEWKRRVEDGSGLYSDGKFFWRYRIGSAPHSLFTFPGRGPPFGNVWIRQWGGETLDDHLHFFLGGWKVCYMKGSVMFCMSDCN